MLGKLDYNTLKDVVLDVIKRRRAEVVTGVAIGEDCATFNLDGDILITTDPITSADKNAGSLAINVSANDIAASGGEPILALLTIIVPQNFDSKSIKEIVVDAEKAASQLNIEIAGGHTEYTNAVNKPIVSVCMVGRAINKEIKSSTAKVGDSIFVTKSIGIEGTSILINDYLDKLKNRLTVQEIAEAKDFINKISVVKEGKILSLLKGITSMHDITEGGLFGSLIEVSRSNGLGAKIDIQAIPLQDITKKICDILQISPYNLISSGSMLFTTNNPDYVAMQLKRNGIDAHKIGVVSAGEVIGIEKGREFLINTTFDEICNITK